MTASSVAHRPSLSRHLMLPIALLMTLTVVASLVGWYALSRIGKAQDDVIDRAIPLVNLARDISLNLASINALAPSLINPVNESQLSANSASLSNHTSDLINLLNQPVIAGETIHSAIYAEEIKTIVKSLTLLVRKRLFLKNNLRRLSDESVQTTLDISRQLRPLHVDLSDNSLNITDSIFDELENNNIPQVQAGIDALIDINLSSETILGIEEKTVQVSSLLEGSNLAESTEKGVSLTPKIDFAIRSMVSDTLSLSDSAEKTRVLEYLEKLYDTLVKDGRLATMVSDLDTVNTEIDVLYNNLWTNIKVLNTNTDNLVQLAKSTEASAASNAKNIARWNNTALLVIAICSFVLSILVAWRFIYLRTVLPINELTDAVDSISENRLGVDIGDYPIHELSKMSAALEVFRQNALELESHERKLSAQNDLLKSINEELNTFVRVASHDLKSPLRGIVILADFIRQDIESGQFDTVGEHLSTLEARISRMNNLLNSLLRFVKIGEISEAAEQVNIADVVHEAHELQHGKENFQLIIDSDLPVLNTHVAPLAQVFRNLFDNAIKHHDQLIGTLAVSCAELPNHFEFSVSDNGPGIEPAYHEKIFEVFQTLKPRDEVEGSGMGLSEVKKVIEKMGGEIAVESNAPDERGTTFTFTWPKITDNAA